MLDLQPRLWSLACGLVLLAGCAAVEPDPPRASAGDDGEAAATQGAPPPAASRAYVDPQTGRLTSEPAAGEEVEPGPATAERLRRDSQGLEQEPLPGGGAKVRLGGRFHSTLVASLDEEGNLTTECVEEHAEGEEVDHDH